MELFGLGLGFDGAWVSEQGFEHGAAHGFCLSIKTRLRLLLLGIVGFWFPVQKRRRGLFCFFP